MSDFTSLRHTVETTLDPITDQAINAVRDLIHQQCPNDHDLILQALGLTP